MDNPLKGLVETGMVKGPQVVMLALLLKPEGASASEIEDATGLAPNVISAALSKLENEKLIVRHTPLRDQRQVRAHLTDKGRDKAKKGAAAIQNSARVLGVQDK